MTPRDHAVAVLGRLPGHLTMPSLVQYVADQRGRPVVIRERSELTGTGICGLWQRGGDVEVILHAPTASPLHRVGIVLHEIAHMLLEHDTDEALAQDSMWPDLPAGRILLRSALDDPREQAAELLADYLYARMRRAPALVSFERVFGWTPR